MNDTKALLEADDDDEEMDLFDATGKAFKKSVNSARKAIKGTSKSPSLVALCAKEFLGMMLIAMLTSTTVCLFPEKTNLLMLSVLQGGITMAIHWFFTRGSPNDFNIGITMCRLTTAKIGFIEALVLLLGNAAGNAAGVSLTMGFVVKDLFWNNAPSIFNPYNAVNVFDSYQAMGALACAQFCLYLLGSSYEFLFTKTKRFGKSALIGLLVLSLNIATYSFASGGLNFLYALMTSGITSNLTAEWGRVYALSNLISVAGTTIVYWLMNWFQVSLANINTVPSKKNTE
jgi:hypothetical protein